MSFPYSKILLKLPLTPEQASILAKLGVRIDARTAKEVEANNERLKTLAIANGFVASSVRNSGGHKLTDSGQEKTFEHVVLGELHDDYVAADYVNADVTLLHKEGKNGKNDARWFLTFLYLPDGEGVKEIELSQEARTVIAEDHLALAYEFVYAFNNFRTDGSATVNAVRPMYGRRNLAPLRMAADGEFYQA